MNFAFPARGDDSTLTNYFHVSSVIEDCGITLEDLRNQGFSESIVQAVDGLTRRNDETYEAFIDRAAKNPLSAEVIMMIIFISFREYRNYLKSRIKDIEAICQLAAVFFELRFDYDASMSLLETALAKVIAEKGDDIAESKTEELSEDFTESDRAWNIQAYQKEKDDLVDAYNK